MIYFHCASLRDWKSFKILTWFCKAETYSFNAGSALASKPSLSKKSLRYGVAERAALKIGLITNEW